MAFVIPHMVACFRSNFKPMTRSIFTKCVATMKSHLEKIRKLVKPCQTYNREMGSQIKL